VVSILMDILSLRKCLELDPSDSSWDRRLDTSQWGMELLESIFGHLIHID
jgi:hypothetical protein